MNRKAMAVLLAASMMVASTVTSYAVDGSGGSDAPASEEVTKSEETSKSSTSSSDEKSESSSSETSVALSDVFVANAPINVGGKVVKTSVNGIYAARSVKGIAVVAPISTVSQSMGLTGDQKPYIMVFDTDKKKSYLAMQSIHGALEAYSGTLVSVINMYAGYLEKGKYVPGTTGTIPMVLGIPNSALIPGKEYFLIAVMPGGKIVILKDLDDDPNTVTFDAIPGNNAFALAYK